MNESTTTQVALTLDLKQFYASLQKVEGASKETTTKLQQMFGTVEVPIDASKVNKALAPVGAQFDNVGQSAQSLNNIISDAPLVFQSFDTGIIAASNHLSPLISDLIRAKTPTVSWKSAISSVTTGLTGVGGLSIAFAIAGIALTEVIKLFSESESENKKMRKTVSELSEEYQTLSEKIADVRKEINDLDVTQLPSVLRGLKEEAEALNDEFETTLGYAVQFSGSQYGGLLAKIFGATPEDLVKISTNRAQIDASLDAMTDMGTNLNILQSKFGKGSLSGALNQFTKKELTDMGNKLEYIANNTLPSISKELDFNGVKFKTTGAEAKSLAEAINNLTKNQKDKKEKDLITTDAEIRAEIKAINTMQTGNVSVAERMRLEEKKIGLVKQLTVVTIDLIKAEEKRNRIREEKGVAKSLKGPFNIEKIDPGPKPQAFKETNTELQRMLDLSDLLTTSFNRAGNAVASAAASGISLFRTENSLLQIFINNLIRAAAEAITLKLITTGLNIIGGLFGFPFFGSAATGVAGLTSGGGNAPMINSGGTGLSNFNMSNNRPMYSGSHNYTVTVNQTPVVMETRVKGKDIYFSQKKFVSYRRRLYGSND